MEEEKFRENVASDNTATELLCKPSRADDDLLMAAALIAEETLNTSLHVGLNALKIR